MEFVYFIILFRSSQIEFSASNVGHSKQQPASNIYADIIAQSQYHIAI